MQRRTILCLVVLAACVLLASAQSPQKKDDKKPNKEECSFKGDEWKKSLTTAEKCWGGAFARLCSQTLLHPLDTMRTRRQAKGGLHTSWHDTTKGLIPQMAGAMPAGALQFMAYESSKAQLNTLLANYTLGGAKPHLVEVCAASIGACAASLIRVPQERIKQPVQADIYPNWLAAINGNLAQGGMGAFFVGMKATLLRDVPWNALSFLFFNAFKSVYESLRNKAPAQTDTMALGAVAGALAAVIMTPIDVVKTRLMLQTPVNGVLPYLGIRHSLFKVAREEGPGALMKGVMPRILYLGPLSAITLSIYEYVGKGILLRKGPQWCKEKKEAPKTSKAK